MNQSAQNLTWYKSSLSGANTDNCVEVANLSGGGRTVRDSKNPNGSMLNFSSDGWRAFIGGVRSGEFHQR